jgi:hypothetical protein
MKKILFSILLFVSGSIFGQNSNLNFLKSPIDKGDPTIDEAVKWLDQNIKKNITKGDISKQCCRMDYELSGGRLLIDNKEYFIPCWAPFNLNYIENQNAISFKISTIGCGGCCSCCIGDVEQTGTVTLLLSNLKKYSHVRNNEIEFKSWNNEKRGIDYSNYDLGVIIWDNNYDLCSGSSIKTFNQITFPLKDLNSALEMQFETAICFIGEKCSAEGAKCRDFGACLAANTKVLINESKSTTINLLKKGDKILTYDLLKKVVEETEIERVDSVYHKNLVKLIFSNDTITCTKDHPFYIENKGWCSLEPQKTLNNYSNYPKVYKFNKNDWFIFKNGKDIIVNKLIDIVDLKNDYGQMTYTITKLKKGNTYFANGILTGVEYFKNEIIVQSK